MGSDPPLLSTTLSLQLAHSILTFLFLRPLEQDFFLFRFVIDFFLCRGDCGL